MALRNTREMPLLIFAFILASPSKVSRFDLKMTGNGHCEARVQAVGATEDCTGSPSVVELRQLFAAWIMVLLIRKKGMESKSLNRERDIDWGRRRWFLKIK